MRRGDLGALKFMAAAALAVLFLLAGCQRGARFAGAGEGGSASGAGKGAGEPARIVLETARERTAKETAPGEEESKEVEAGEPLALLPELVSTSANASQVALAYAFAPGAVVDRSVIEEIGEEAFFVQMMIDDELFSRMENKSYKADCPLPVTELRYLRVLHCDLFGEVHIGELVCNRSISDDVLTIFHKLYQAGYPIEKMLLIDEYENADILLSSADNNTAAFNYRNTVGKTTKSLHAQGIAIDINPLYNPYVMYQPDGTYQVAPANGEPYMDRTRTDIPYKIDENDLCYQLFTEAGFTWGGIWNSPDYMHFFRK